jgi:hypothetical protein
MVDQLSSNLRERAPFPKETLLKSINKDFPLLYVLVEHGGFPTKHAAALPGAKESLECEPGTMRLVLQNRKGFARLALRTLMSSWLLVAGVEGVLHWRWMEKIR